MRNLKQPLGILRHRLVEIREHAAPRLSGGAYSGEVRSLGEKLFHPATDILFIWLPYLVNPMDLLRVGLRESWRRGLRIAPRE
jgi:hypothetical protein